jgi:tetratricopeptide (TPR) repeat protein
MLQQAGRFEEGEVQLRSAVAKFSAAISPDYSRTMLAQTKLAQCLLPQGKLDEALEVALAAESTARTVFTEPHSKLGQALRVLATVYRERGEYEAADALYREAIAVYEQTEEQPLVWATRTELLYASSLVAQDRLDIARDILMARDKMLASSGDDYVESRREIGAMLASIDALGTNPAPGQ